MANYTLFYNLIKEIPTNLRRLITRRLKRFNALPRAHKAIDKVAEGKGERAPFPEQIQKRIDEVLKNDPTLLEKYTSEKHETLLERLKQVFVTSAGHNKDMFNKTRLTPIQYNLFKPDKIEEYKETIPEGKYSLQQADMFLKAFNENPSVSAVDALSERLKIEPHRIRCLLTHTKIFKAALPIKEKKKSIVQNTLQSMLPSIIQTEPDEEKIYRILDRRTEKFRQFYEEKLGVPTQNFPYVAKKPATRKVVVPSDMITSTNQPSVGGSKKKETFVTARDKIVDSSPKSTTIEVTDFKPGENPNEWERLPEFPYIQKMGRIRTGDDPNKLDQVVGHPEHEKFDVFKITAEQDRKARIEKKKEEEMAKIEERKQEEMRLQEEKKKQLEDGVRKSDEEEQPRHQTRGQVSSENK